MSEIDICKTVCPCSECSVEQEDCRLADAWKKQLRNGWIPVSYKLPDKYANYNVSCKNKDGAEWVSTMAYMRELFGGTESFNNLVIAWQPLPEPYKK